MATGLHHNEPVVVDLSVLQDALRIELSLALRTYGYGSQSALPMADRTVWIYLEKGFFTTRIHAGRAHIATLIWSKFRL